MLMPKVSIITTNYNQIDFIEETLTSAIEQDYDNLEVVIADDGSSDGSEKIILEYAQRFPSRVKAITGGPNLGITGNTNRALRESRGDFIALQGGDDVLLPGKISKQIEWFSASEKRVLCYHDVEVFDSLSNKTICNYSAIAPFVSGYGAEDVIARMRLGAATSIMVRRTASPKFGFDKRLPMVSDWKFQIDTLSAGGEYGYIEGVYARYRRHGNNSRLKAPQKYYDDCLMTLDIVEKDYPQYSLACRKARARIYGGLAVTMAFQRKYRSVFKLYMKSVRYDYSWKLLPGLVYVLFPQSFQKQISKMLGKYIPELKYILY